MVILVIVTIMKNPWFTSHVDSGDIFDKGACAKNVVTNLMKGLCHGGSKDDMRNCTTFSDTSYFQDLDNYFADYGLDTNMVHGAEQFNHAHNFIITILAFAVLTAVASAIADVTIPKEYHRALRVFLSILGVLSFGFTILMMYLGNDDNELLNYDAWMILYCYDEYKAKVSFDNSIIADFAYVVCILLMGVQFGSISLLLFPGNCCCCCDCTWFSCCSCMRDSTDNGQKQDAYQYAPVLAYEASAPLLQHEHPIQAQEGHVWIASQPVYYPQDQQQQQQQQQAKVLIYQPSQSTVITNDA